MKISAQQLPQQLQKNLSAIYVVCGDETLLVQEACELIRDAAAKAGFTERVRIQVDTGSDWGKSLYEHSQSLSLFANQRLLELDLTTIKLNATSSKVLQDYMLKPPSDTILLISTHKVDSKSEQTTWYKSLDKVSTIIPIWPISIEQLPAWILQRAKKLELNLTKSAADLLASLVEGNLLAAAQELEKLRLLQLTDVIDHHTIEDAITDHAHFDIFALVDSTLTGNTQRSLRIIENLAAEDTEPTLILWALTRELRTLADMANQMQQGATLSALFPKFRIWEKRQSIIRTFLQRNKTDACWEWLKHAAHIDRMIKGADSGNAWTELSRLVFSMSSK